ncbi:hypothetical protein HWV62_21776 [Athelia sp. TMB]|nr:hypothetical protein HWV62_21776 [Athelia sp. TMB]
MSSSDFHIRPARPEDVVVRIQAVYEKEPDAVKATPELTLSLVPSQLRKHLFETRFANALLAFRGNASSPGEAVGLALYFFNYSTWTGRPGLYLEDLYVSPDQRGKGLGKALFAELGKVAQEKFYEKTLSAAAMSEWLGMRLEEDGIEALKKFAA